MTQLLSGGAMIWIQAVRLWSPVSESLYCLLNCLRFVSLTFFEIFGKDSPCSLSCLHYFPSLTTVDMTSILIRDFQVSKESSLILLHLSAALNDVDGLILWVLSVWLQRLWILSVFLLPPQMPFFLPLLSTMWEFSKLPSSTFSLDNLLLEALWILYWLLSNGCL